jgi:hypothetical protein
LYSTIALTVFYQFQSLLLISFFFPWSSPTMGTPATVGSLSLEELERTFGVLFVGYILAMVGYGFTFFRA